MLQDRIYLDNAATTPLCDAAREAMAQTASLFGNPSSQHENGVIAKQKWDETMQSLAQLLGTYPENLIITSGGSEADNLAIKGYAFAHQKQGKHLIVSQTEHSAVLQSAAFLQRCGYEVTYLPVDREGYVSREILENAIREDTILCAVMHVNNETGTVQDISALGALSHRYHVAFFSDGVANGGHLPMALVSGTADLYSLSAHKFGGPKGIGLLYQNKGVFLEPLIHGGAQQRNRRAGTESLMLLSGMTAALKQTIAEQKEFFRKAEILRNLLLQQLSKLPGMHCHSPKDALPSTLNVSFNGITGESMVNLLDLQGISVSTGSACHAGDLLPSHVLIAMGISEKEANETIRITLSESNTEEEIMRTAKTIGMLIEKLHHI